MKCLFIFATAIYCSLLTFGQDIKTPSPIVFIYDASGSMWGKIQGKAKKDIAAEVLTTTVSKLPAEQKIGLVAYGHRKKDDCEDVEFLVAVQTGTKAEVNSAVRSIKSLGRTPLAYSAKQVIDNLRSSKTKATIILVTDGIESCGGNICDVIAAAKKEGIDFKLHIIGFGLKENETEQLKCAAKAGNGRYYDAADADGLGDVLNDATTESVDKPGGNYTVYAVKNGKAIDALIKGTKKGNSKSEVLARTYRDTVSFHLPEGVHDLEIVPLEGTDVNSVTIAGVEYMKDSANHQTVSFDAGKIMLNTTNNGEGWDCIVKIYQHGTKKLAASGRTYGRNKAFELNPGKYDVEVTAMVIEGTDTKHDFSNVPLSANQENQLTHNFESGVAMIGAVTGSGLVDAIVKITDTKTNKIVASGRTYTSPGSNPKKFIINPGNYSVTLTGLGTNKGKNGKLNITVKAGETTESIAKL